MTDYIQVRINHSDKVKATKVFERLGIDVSTAIRMFIKQSIIKNTLPFSLNDSADYDYLSAMDNILAMQAEAEKNNCQDITLEEINQEIADYRAGK